MKGFLTLWAGQSLSSLGSAMTGYALVIWSYTQEGSALTTALLMVSSYAPYVLLSVFAGALSERWNKKATMLACDFFAALTTVAVLLLLRLNRLEIWHIYLINAVSGVMNTVQQPASEVAVTRLLPKQHYQKVGGLRYFSNSLNTIFTPILTTAVLGFWGMEAVIAIDLCTFCFAFLSLLLFIRLPENSENTTAKECFADSVKGGLHWLKTNRGVLMLILLLAAINLVASMYNAAFPAMMLSRQGGSEQVMGIVNTVIGVSMLAGSVLASFAKEPKSRVRVICNCLLLSMGTENLLLALGRNVWVWSIGGFLGWIAIPLMNANLDAVIRTKTPETIQGRVYSVRNSLQFFTIPIGYLLGGAAVDYVFEPFMAAQEGGVLAAVFGTGKGSGAALFFLFLAALGMAVCLAFRKSKALWRLE